MLRNTGFFLNTRFLGALVSWGGLPANPQAYEPLGSTHPAPTYQLGVVSRRPRRTRPQQGWARSRRRKRGASPPPGKSRTGPAGRRALWPSPPEGGRGFEWASSGREWASSGREWARVGERVLLTSVLQVACVPIGCSKSL